MTSLDTLPGDQRAVLELVVRRGRGCEEIERLLSIDRMAVRARALAALDAIGPPTGVPAARRALLADYLLGQLPPRVSDEARPAVRVPGGVRLGPGDLIRAGTRGRGATAPARATTSSSCSRWSPSRLRTSRRTSSCKAP